MDTLELRWFVEGALPGAVEEAFVGPLAESRPSRADAYLLGTGDSVGLKIREGRRELKLRTGRERGRHGTLEAWTKWRLDDGVAGAGAWLEVAKRRRLRRFSLGGGELRETAAADRAGVSCQAELTSLRVDGRHAWTVAFEAVGPAEPRRRALEACVDRLLGELPRFDPAGAACMGYPEWIGRRR